MKYHTLFFSKIRKMSGNLSSAAVVIGTLRVNTFIYYSGSSNIIDIVYLYLTSPKALCCVLEQDTLGTSAYEKLRSEFIKFSCNCVIDTLRLIVYLTGFSI